MARELAMCRAGNVFIADGAHGAVVVDQKGLMNISVTWESENQFAISYPPNARVFKQANRLQTVTVKYAN
jgi:hypothetical protein